MSGASERPRKGRLKAVHWVCCMPHERHLGDFCKSSLSELTEKDQLKWAEK